MLPVHLGLISQTSRVGLPALMQASAALQKQLTRDFGPIWNVNATINAFASLRQLPIGYWPILIRDDIGFPGAAGIHLDNNGQPYALVQYSPDWVLTTSHEVLEMLADPTGNRLVAGQSPKSGQGRVEFLVEVCDPSEDKQFGYTINGLRVSDFYTPRYFDPIAAPGVMYSFAGAITRPRQVLKGGYLSWLDPVSNTWWQERWFGTARSVFKHLSLSGQGSLRSQIDAVSPTEVTIPKAPSKKAQALLVAAAAAEEVDNCFHLEEHDESSLARASSLEGQIAAMRQSFGLT